MKVLVTGGAGYIGSHTVVELLQAGHEISVIDNLCNSKPTALKRVMELSGREFDFFKVDLLDESAVNEIFKTQVFDAVIHFAGLKAVGESTQIPLTYYHNNITSTLLLCKAMKKNRVKRLVFSSSATVYGDPVSVPIREDFSLSATNPYGRTKLMIEEFLRDLAQADPRWQIAILRYFNPIGAHPSGRIGEDPNGIPNNLVPFIAQVAVGKREKLRIFGNDYPTRDGTGVRDYIHVKDLAMGHLKALEKLECDPGLVTYNLGTGRGYSVLEVVNAFENVSTQTIPYEIVERRAGDVASCFADPGLAQSELDWQCEYGIDEMCRDTWNWQQNNPNGYPEG
jgi:UDP-glucose 4-epimerase